MTIHCPACGKRNEGTENSACTRCDCDLSALQQILAAAVARLSQAKETMKQADWPAALVHAEQSWKMAHTPQSARIACLATAAMRDVESLARWRRRAQEVAED